MLNQILSQHEKYLSDTDVLSMISKYVFEWRLFDICPPVNLFPDHSDDAIGQLPLRIDCHKMVRTGRPKVPTPPNLYVHVLINPDHFLSYSEWPKVIEQFLKA